jgi:HK97 family phage prohead protease
MKYYDVKNIDKGVLDVDTKSNRVKVAISRMGTLDLDNDIIDKTAYNRTIKERGPKGANLIWHLTDHNASMTTAIAKFKELYVEGDYLIGVTDIPETTIGKDMMILYQEGHINQHSVGFRTISSEPQKAGTPQEYRLIKEILLYEGSAVLWAAHPDTPTISVGKSLTKDEYDKEFLETTKQINNLAKLLRKGKLSDTSLELMEIDLIQKTEKLKQLYEATQPAYPASDPAESLFLAIKEFNNTFN